MSHLPSYGKWENPLFEVLQWIKRGMKTKCAIIHGYNEYNEYNTFLYFLNDM